MGIGWLWHHTRSDRSDRFRETNEAKAAAFHARWCALHLLFEDALRRLRDRGRDARRRRAGLRELAALSDDALEDIGLRLDGTGRLVPGSEGRAEDLARAFDDVVRLEPVPRPSESAVATRSAGRNEPIRRRAA